MRCVITTTPGPLGIVYIYGDYSDDGDTRTDLTRGMTQRHPPSRRKGRRGWMSRSNTGAAPVKGRGCVCVDVCVCGNVAWPYCAEHRRPGVATLAGRVRPVVAWCPCLSAALRGSNRSAYGASVTPRGTRLPLFIYIGQPCSDYQSRPRPILGIACIVDFASRAFTLRDRRKRSAPPL